MCIIMLYVGKSQIFGFDEGQIDIVYDMTLKKTSHVNVYTVYGLGGYGIIMKTSSKTSGNNIFCMVSAITASYHIQQKKFIFWRFCERFKFLFTSNLNLNAF